MLDVLPEVYKTELTSMLNKEIPHIPNGNVMKWVDDLVEGADILTKKEVRELKALSRCAILILKKYYSYEYFVSNHARRIECLSGINALDGHHRGVLDNIRLLAVQVLANNPELTFKDLQDIYKNFKCPNHYFHDLSNWLMWFVWRFTPNNFISHGLSLAEKNRSLNSGMSYCDAVRLVAVQLITGNYELTTSVLNPPCSDCYWIIDNQFFLILNAFKYITVIYVMMAFVRGPNSFIEDLRYLVIRFIASP